MRTLSRLLPSILLLMALAAPGGASEKDVGQSPPYDVFIESGLVPDLPLSRVVPSLPARLGGGRIGGTIQSIERVAFVLGQNTPSIDPELSRQPSDVPVWVVVCRGQFHLIGPFDYSASGTRAFFYVDHKSGVRYAWGLLPDAKR
jgi:hypothetical protein